MGSSPFGLGLFQLGRQSSKWEGNGGDQPHRSMPPQALAHSFEVIEADADTAESQLPGGVAKREQFLLRQQWIEQSLVNQRGDVRQILPAR